MSEASPERQTLPVKESAKKQGSNRMKSPVRFH